jgi:predicted DNA-binding protein
MARNDPQFNLRLPADLKQRIEAQAESYGISATAAIVEALDEQFPHVITTEDVFDLLRAVEEFQRTHPDRPMPYHLYRQLAAWLRERQMELELPRTPAKGFATVPPPRPRRP